MGKLSDCERFILHIKKPLENGANTQKDRHTKGQIHKRTDTQKAVAMQKIVNRNKETPHKGVHPLQTAGKAGLLLFFISVFASCVSTYTALQEMEPGLSKKEVRIRAGRPFSVGRTDGLDRWTYKFQWQSQDYTQDLFFNEGLVEKTGPLTPYPNYKQKMISAETPEEYENHARLYQKQKAQGFREINTTAKSNDVMDFCRKTHGHRMEQCITILTNGLFALPSLHFCINYIQGDKAKEDCLVFIRNKTFQPNTLEFCGNRLGGLDKMMCLKQSHYQPLRFPQKHEVTIFNCSHKEQRFLMSTPSSMAQLSNFAMFLRNLLSQDLSNWYEQPLSGWQTITVTCDDHCQNQVGSSQPPIQFATESMLNAKRSYGLAPQQMYILSWNITTEQWDLFQQSSHIVCGSDFTPPAH